MCTLLYLPLKKSKFILTSNRDKSLARKTILFKKYLEKGVNITYPKDEVVVGACIDATAKNRLVCLLNEGYENIYAIHIIKICRGVVVKNILTEDYPVHQFNDAIVDRLNVGIVTLKLVLFRMFSMVKKPLIAPMFDCKKVPDL